MYRLIILLFFVIAHSATILNISYFPLGDKIDILFSLDKPFDGKVIYLSKNSYKLTNLTLNRVEEKKIKNSLDIKISPIDNNNLKLDLSYEKELKVNASVTTKGYGLRIRITGLEEDTEIPDVMKSLTTQKFDNSKGANKTQFNFVNYAIVVSILISLSLILFYFKKKAVSKLPTTFQKDNYKLLYQKMIDPKNRVVLIELFEKRYLLLLGEKNNILLDKFSNEVQEELKKVSSQKEFNNLLDDKSEKIEEESSALLKDASKIKGENEV